MRISFLIYIALSMAALISADENLDGIVGKIRSNHIPIAGHGMQNALQFCSVFLKKDERHSQSSAVNERPNMLNAQDGMQKRQTGMWGRSMKTIGNENYFLHKNIGLSNASPLRIAKV